MALILVVDDELTILDVISTILESENHEVVTELDSLKAKDLMVERHFDLLLSDIRMKPVNGMQLLRHAHENCPWMTVILLTAFGQVETAVEAMELGAFDYLAKPFRSQQLIDVVAKAVAARSLDSTSKPGE
jgi:DNA-binding NtrC family response regulator